MAKDNNNTFVCKDAIIAWIIIAKKSFTDHGNWVVYAEPVTASWDLYAEALSSLKLESDIKILGVIPAQPNSYLVYCCPNENEECEEIGYEIQGADHPDWLEECKKKAKSRR